MPPRGFLRLFTPRSASTLFVAFSFFFLGFISNGLYNRYPTYRAYDASGLNLDQPLNAVSDAIQKEIGSSNMTQLHKPEVVSLPATVSAIRHVNVPELPDDRSGVNYVKKRPQGPKVADVLGHSRNFTKISHIDRKVTASLPPVIPLDIASIPEKVNNFYYIKIHKTGSTTLQNIIYRYGFQHNLTFALFNCENAMPFPNPAFARYFIPSEIKAFNIVGDHALFDINAYKPYMVPDTKVISQLRHPMKYLTSSFGFQYLDRAYQLSRNKDPVATFLKNPNDYDKRARWKGSSQRCGPLRTPSFTKNAMAYHMGYMSQYQDDIEEIKAFLTRLDAQVHHVLILEKFDESLIVLKRLFKWETRDILYMPLWSLKFHGRKSYHKLRPREEGHLLEQLHKAWAPADYAVYEFYTKKLDATLEQQEQDFWDEVDNFKDIVSKVKSFCTSMCQVTDKEHVMSMSRDEAFTLLQSNKYTFLASKWNVEFSITFLDCIKMVLATMEYHAASKARQIPNLCKASRSLVPTKSKLDPRYCKSRDRLVFTFPWSFIKTKIFRSKFECLKHVNG